MAASSINQPTELKTSRSGRLLIPRLKNWTGERILVKKTGFVQIFEGSPDCTTTFVPERKLFQACPSPALSQSLSVSRATNFPKNIVKRKANESLPTLGSWETDKEDYKQKRRNSNLKHSKGKNVMSSMRLSKKDSALPQSQPQILKDANRSPAEKIECTRKSRSLTRKRPSSRSPRLGKRDTSSPTKRRSVKTPLKRSSSLMNHGTSTLKSPAKEIPSHCSPPRAKRQVNVSSKKSPREKLITTVPTRSSPRKTAQQKKMPIMHDGINSKNSIILQTIEKEKSSVLKRVKHSNKARINMANEVPVFDIFGPQFQPVVRLVRLLPEEILHLTGTANLVTVKSPPADDRRSPRQTLSRKRKSPASPQKKSPTKKKSPLVAKTLSRRTMTRTVRDTQKILETLKKATVSNEAEDDVTSTGAFFKNSQANMLKNLPELDDILNDNFDESDDNLSFRSAYERESSPMPSVPVSPISSFHETDAENSGLEDVLFNDSPIASKPTSFQKAQLLHRTLKNREAVARKLKKLRKETGEVLSSAVFPPIEKAPTNPASCPLLQPKSMRALEKNLKKKAILGEKFSYETQYNGNTLHISLNSSDSETSENSLDSDME